MPASLPPLPARIARLPKDERGYPTPWFVAYLSDDLEDRRREVPRGTPGAWPDFRVIGSGKLTDAYKTPRCWVCGDRLGVHRVAVVGPMCVVNRVTSEPWSHRECAEFAAKACPFLTRPRMKRNEKDLPQGRVSAGMHIDRNPGAICLYETASLTPFKAGNGVLFRLGAPSCVDWWAEGRKATRTEIEASIESGFPFLLDTATRYDGPEGVAELERHRVEALRLLPAA